MLEIRLEKFDAVRVGKVLKWKEYSKLVSAKQLIADAKVERDGIIKRAQDENAKIIARANGEAKKIINEAKATYESEKKRGYDDGISSGKEEMADQLMELATKSADSFAKLEKDVIDVVARAIKKILGDVDKNELITSVVKNALKMVKSQKQAVLKVAPSEATFLRDRVVELTKDTPGIEFLDVVSDAHLAPGSCLLETDLGVVDASVSVQIAAIEKSLGRMINERK
ncbi:MAG: HrpE/YscL family type III secretion apparatus protein [Puniceicoccales bacterium]|jgi:type III secretion protein L|nr:HrpE/YscL family type III secretion apparatus protein [Puniceicoccales bacterium]